jgi:hypothetical protein
MTSDELLIAWHEALQPFAVQRFVWDAVACAPAELAFAPRLVALKINAFAAHGILSVHYTDVDADQTCNVVVQLRCSGGRSRPPSAVVGEILRRIPDQLLTWSHAGSALDMVTCQD